MRTVRDFKTLVCQEIGTQFSSHFAQRSEAHRVFWNKLNKLGARNMKSQPPESVPDIDATVLLTDQEWTQLEAEFRQLQ